ncbi:MAG: hypothetical protein VB109_08220 [Desulfitobacterium hafniense]|uniref:hypothetical protein n=1 Tax=Desulfitobacterium hafniense TaxID=49338 RepID=UPI001AD805FE|nr:hypothetical protein [Desulfitobacterium hafniense]MEA5022813.1 hypothetical protein [Desulfitobacterium hafniense]
MLQDESLGPGPFFPSLPGRWWRHGRLFWLTTPWSAAQADRLLRNTLKMTPLSSAKVPKAVLRKGPGSVALRTKANGFSRGAVG